MMIMVLLLPVTIKIRNAMCIDDYVDKDDNGMAVKSINKYSIILLIFMIREKYKNNKY